MDIAKKIKHLENAHMHCRSERLIFKRELQNPKVPSWAEEAFLKYKEAGFDYDERGHSMDFYRVITLLHERKLL